MLSIICNVHAIVCYHLPEYGMKLYSILYATVCYNRLHAISCYGIIGDNCSAVRRQCAIEEHPADIHNCHPQPSNIHQTWAHRRREGDAWATADSWVERKLRPDGRSPKTHPEKLAVAHISGEGLCVLWGTNRVQPDQGTINPCPGHPVGKLKPLTAAVTLSDTKPVKASPSADGIYATQAAPTHTP